MFGKYIHPFALNENVEQAKSILRKLSIAPDDEAFQTIRGMLEKKMGWVGIFTRFHFEEKVPLEELAQLLDRLNELKPFLARLPKTVAEYSRYEALVDDLNRLELKRKSSRLVQELSAEQKQYVRTASEEQQDKFDQLALAFYDLSPEQQQRILGKLKSFQPNKVIDELLKVVESLSGMQSGAVLADIKSTGGGAEVVLNDRRSGILVVRLHTFKANQLLNKSTLWCIRDSMSNWKNYVMREKALNAQYTIYNFNLPSTDANCMIGVTITPKGTVHAAHSRLDANLKGAKLQSYLGSVGLRLDVLAPPSAIDNNDYKRIRKHMKDLDDAIYSRSASSIMALVTADDIATDEGAIASIIASQGTVGMVKRLVELGCKFTGSKSSLGLTNTPFIQVCSSSHTAVIEFLMEMGFPSTNEERKHYALYLLRNNSDAVRRVELEAVVDRLPPTEQAVVGGTLLSRNAVAECEWFFERYPLDRDAVLSALAKISHVVNAPVARIFLEKTSETRFSDAFAGFIRAQFSMGSYAKKDVTYFLDLIKKHAQDFTQANTAFITALDVDAAMNELVKLNLPDLPFHGAALYCLKRAQNDGKFYDYYDQLISRCERETTVSIPTILSRVINEMSSDVLAHVLDRGFKDKQGNHRNLSNLESLDNLIQGRASFDMCKVLLERGFRTKNQQVNQRIIALAISAGDLDILNLLLKENPLTDEDSSNVLGQLLYNREIDSAIEWVSFKSKGFRETLTPELTHRLLSVQIPEGFAQITSHSIKYSRIEPDYLTAILVQDYAFKIPFLMTLNIDAGALLMHLARNGHYECAKELVKSMTPKFKAKVMALLPGFVQKLVLGAPTTVTTEVLRSFLVRLMDANERRLICRWGDYQAG